MQIKTEEYKQKAIFYLQRFSDLRFAGQVVFAIIVLLITWSGVKSIQTNYGLQKQISTLNQQNAVKKLENRNLELQNQYFKSNQYLELSARQNFGLAARGEKELIIPKNVALAYTADLPTNFNAIPVEAQQPAYQQNFQSWVNFFLHRSNN